MKSGRQTAPGPPARRTSADSWPPVRERPVERSGAVYGILRAAHGLSRQPRVVDHGDLSRRTGKRVGLEVSGADAVRQPVCRRPGDRRVRAEQRPGALPGGRSGVLVNPAGAHRHRRPHRLPRRLRDDVDGAGHGVRAPGGRRRPAHHFDLLDVALIGRQQIPHDQSEEIQIDAAAVHQHELRIGHRPGGLPAGDLHVARRELNHVDAGHRAEDVAEVRAGRCLQGFSRDHRGRHWRIDEPDLGP